MATDQVGGRWANWTIPEGYEAATIDACRGCSRTILWCRTQSGRWTPVDRDGTSHFATCPEAERFRRRPTRRHDTI